MTSAEKRTLCASIANVAIQSDQRITQVISNACSANGHREFADLFYVSDEFLRESIEAYVEAHLNG